MAEKLLNPACIALADQIEAALKDEEIQIEEQREIIVDDLWNELDDRHGFRVKKLYKLDGTAITRPFFVRSRRNRS